jgi:hypothetical protein
MRPNLHLAALAGRLIGAGVPRERGPEHQGDAFAHHADLVDGVDERFSGSVQQIALRVTNHQKYQSDFTTIFNGCPVFSTSAASHFSWSWL